MNEMMHWWQTGIIYQIYPRSFQDSNGDGVGDLAGITSRLDYLQWLGIDALWLSPIFPSPMADFGYDVSNYTDIDPLFGSLADFDALLAAAHARGLRVLLDLVPNHTSDEHPWFVASRSSRADPKRSWYMWRDPAPGGGPPNNWQSLFGGDAWTFDPATGQYYLHLFHSKQPDLNWRNPAVRAAMYDVIRFWFDRGVDGFRIDVIWLLIKEEQLSDNPPNPEWQEGDPTSGKFLPVYSADQPEVHQVIREMRALTDAYEGRVLIGEIYLPVPRLVTYYGEALDELHLPFNFQLIQLPWRADRVCQAVEAYEAALPPGAWPNWVLGNHDQSRIASRVGRTQARVAQMLLLTLRGTPTCYYGDEIGMHDVPISPEQAFDPVELLSPGYGRDPERTPMQWDASPVAGFSSITPWLPLPADYQQVNVALQREDSTSMLTLFRRLTALRRAHPALSQGSFRVLETGNPAVCTYERESSGERLLVALNFSSAVVVVDLAGAGPSGRLLCSTLPVSSETRPLTPLVLQADEGIVLHL